MDRTTPTGSKAVALAVMMATAMAAAASGSAPSLGCGGAIVHTRGDVVGVTTQVSNVVALPPRLGFGRAGDQRRVARRLGDTLIDATGGHAILSEELPSTDPELLADGIRALGEDPQQTLTFSVIGARAERIETVGISAAVGIRVRPIRRYTDFTIRLDVRRADGKNIMGSIETFATMFTNAPEIDDEGRPQGLQKAIDDAVRAALKSFAPNLVEGAPFPRLVEAPARGEASAISGALAAVDKLRRLQVLYPELSSGDLAALASSSARFLVAKPGRLAAAGLAAGDLISGMGGQDLGGRAAFARTLARGNMPAMSVDRAGGRFLVGQTLVARAAGAPAVVRPR